MALLKIGVTAAALALALAATRTGEAGEATLGSAAAASGRYFGAALDPDALDERPYRDLAATQLTSVTPENAMKWGSVEPLRGRIDWDARGRARRLRQGARAEGSRPHAGLALAIAAVADQRRASRPAELKALMVAHIAAEAGRYKGAIYAWDVVNEPFTDDGNWRNSIWYEAMGADYVAIALKAARAADPEAKLYVNDYNVETAGPKMQRSTISSPRSSATARRSTASACNRISSPARARGLSGGDGKSSRRSASTSRSPSSTFASACPPTTRRSPTQADDYASVVGRAAGRRAASASPPGASPTTVPGFRHSFPAMARRCRSTKHYRPKPAVAAIIEGFTEKAP